jgi:hypothetical protein
MLLKLVLASVAFSTSYKALLASRNKAKVQGHVVLGFHMLISIA